MNTIFALQELRDMGDTADKVAAYLKAQNITGKRGKTGSCPIANYFTTKYSGSCCVGRYYLYFTDENGDSTKLVDLPSAVSGFVCRFDVGWYQELEDK